MKNKKKILVIGGAGFAGSRFIEETKHIYDIQSVDLEWFGCYIENNIKDDYRNLTAEFIQGFDAVLLLAGMSSVGLSIKDNRATFKNNVDNFVDLISKLSPKQKFIYISSSSVYSNDNGAEVNENYAGYSPRNSYDLSKVMIDNYAELECRARNIEFYGLRLGTLAGASIQCRSDIMINSMFHSYKTNGYIQVSNLTINRPILYILDLVDCVKRLIDHHTPNNRAGIYNVASCNKTVEEIAFEVSDYLNCEVKLKKHTGPKPYNFRMSSQRLMDNFMWTPHEKLSIILDDLNDNWHKIKNFARRNEKIEYV